MAVFDDRYLEVSSHVDVFKSPKTEKIADFKKQLTKHYKLETSQFRLWSIQGIQNKITRVSHLLNATDENLCKVFSDTKSNN